MVPLFFNFNYSIKLANWKSHAIKKYLWEHESTEMTQGINFTQAYIFNNKIKEYCTY